MSGLAETRRRIREIVKCGANLTPNERRILHALAYRNRKRGAFFTPDESRLVDGIFAARVPS